MPQSKQHDILLVYPQERVNAFYYMIPLGIASIAAVLQQNDFTVKVIDFNFYKGDFRRDLKKWKPGLIGIGGTTGTRKGSFEIARICKEILPDIPVVYGGPHATFTADDTLNNIKDIDIIVRNEGEYPFLSLADIQIRKENISYQDIPGISFRGNSSIIHNPGKRIDDLNKLPLPARHLFKGNYRIKLDYLGIEADFLITSRGCPFNCDFCAASKMFPGGTRYRCMDHIKKEIDLILSQKKVKALKLFDSTFTVSRKHVTDFCEMIKPYDLYWECEVRADTVDFELLSIMKEAGCCYIDIGLETTDAEILRSIYKTITMNQIENVLNWCNELDIKTKVFFTFGHIDQTYQSCLNDVSYIKKNQDRINFFATTVGIRIYPGTSLEKKVKEAGIISKNFSWVKYKAPKWQYLLFEFEDQLILNQKQLDYKKLFKIVLKLIYNGTIGSFVYIKELLIINFIKTISRIILKFRYSFYYIRRKIELLR